MIVIANLLGGRCLVVLPPSLKNALVTAYAVLHATKATKPRSPTSAVILPCPEGHFRGKSYQDFRTLL